MKTTELATKEDMDIILNRIDVLISDKSRRPLDYVSFEEFKKITGFGDATIWRLENEYAAIKSYKFKGSNKKFYKISELETALENSI